MRHFHMGQRVYFSGRQSELGIRRRLQFWRRSPAGVVIFFTRSRTRPQIKPQQALHADDRRVVKIVKNLINRYCLAELAELSIHYSNKTTSNIA